MKVGSFGVNLCLLNDSYLLCTLSSFCTPAQNSCNLLMATMCPVKKKLISYLLWSKSSPHSMGKCSNCIPCLHCNYGNVMPFVFAPNFSKVHMFSSITIEWHVIWQCVVSAWKSIFLLFKWMLWGWGEDAWSFSSEKQSFFKFMSAHHHLCGVLLYDELCASRVERKFIEKFAEQRTLTS